ncbi:MAG: RNA polymerase sigma factor [Balneolaceae bacterium]|nr:MAG: RNA polymerase sigma factor [Balneolaceae bacterium]
MSVCLRYASGREDALEILNDSFMKVFRNIHSYDENRPFKTWFRRILINTALDHYRANRRHLRLADPGVDIDTAGPSVEPDYEVALKAEEILMLFNRLPEIHRVIFNLYEVEGYNHEEIAGMLDIAPGTSRSHLSRAKKKLETLYLEHLRKESHEAI